LVGLRHELDRVKEGFRIAPRIRANKLRSALAPLGIVTHRTVTLMARMMVNQAFLRSISARAECCMCSDLVVHQSTPMVKARRRDSAGPGQGLEEQLTLARVVAPYTELWAPVVTRSAFAAGLVNRHTTSFFNHALRRAGRFC